MSRTSHAFRMLQAVAAIAGLAVLLWSLGVPSLRFAEAANVTSLSDTLSDSAPSVVSDHTITFVTPTGIANGETVTIDFSDGPFVVGSVDFTDIDVQDGATDLTVEGSCTTQEVAASFSGTTLTIEFCSGNGASIAANGTTTIEIGLNATSGTAGDAQLTNPVAGSYQIVIGGTMTDTGETRVAIIDSVTVTAAVDTSLDFQVNGTSAGLSVNGTSTTGATTATTIPFGELQSGSASTAAQELTVATNAKNGFVVTVIADQQLESATGADIDSFANGGNQSTPTAWTAPSGTLGSENTYGHWGVTTDDSSTGESLTDEFGDQQYVAVSTSSPVEVFRHDGPSDGATASVGSTTVAYSVQITSLQEAGDDYTATLTYVATPVF